MKKKRKYFQKLVAVLLVFVMCFSLAPTTLAADEDISQRAPDETKQYYMDVTDEEGNVITILVEESTYYPTTPATRSTPGQGSGTGKHKEGEKKVYSYKFTNKQINAAGKIGEKASMAILKKLGSLSGNALAVSVGASIAGGLATASYAAKQVVTANTLLGKNGLKVIFTLKWTHFQHTIQGIDLYDWGLIDTDVSPY